MHHYGFEIKDKAGCQWVVAATRKSKMPLRNLKPVNYQIAINMCIIMYNNSITHYTCMLWGAICLYTFVHVAKRHYGQLVEFVL